jgi:hypothetical protein
LWRRRHVHSFETVAGPDRGRGDFADETNSHLGQRRRPNQRSAGAVTCL